MAIQASDWAASNGTALVELVPAISGKRIVVRGIQIRASAQATVKLHEGSTDKNLWLDSNKEPFSLIGEDGVPELVLAKATALKFKLDRAGTDVTVSAIYDTVAES